MSGDGLPEPGAAARLEPESPLPAATEITPQPLVIYAAAKQYVQESATGQRPVGALPSQQEDVPISAMRCGLY